jgi:Zn-dependent protease with chaperone function
MGSSTWKITVAGIEPRDLFYTRPANSNSTFDHLTLRFYQFLSSAAAIGVIALVGWQAGIGAAIATTMLALAYRNFAHKDDRQLYLPSELGVRRMPLLRHPKVLAIQERLQRHLLSRGIMKRLKIVDTEQYLFDASSRDPKISGHTPNAVSYTFLNKEAEGDNAYIGSNDATANLLSASELEAVFRHENTHRERPLAVIRNEFDRKASFTAAALNIGAVMINPYVLPFVLAPYALQFANDVMGGNSPILSFANAAACVCSWVASPMLALKPVQNLIQRSFFRHEEFRADRGAVYGVKNPRIMSSALKKIHQAILDSSKNGYSRWHAETCMGDTKHLDFKRRVLRFLHEYVVNDHPSLERRLRRLDAMARQRDTDYPVMQRPRRMKPVMKQGLLPTPA